MGRLRIKKRAPRCCGRKTALKTDGRGRWVRACPACKAWYELEQEEIEALVRSGKIPAARLPDEPRETILVSGTELNVLREPCASHSQEAEA